MRRNDQFTRWIEGNALGVRQLAGLGPSERLVPRDFAEKLGYQITFPDEIDGLAVAICRQLLEVDAGGWSGSSAVLPDGTPVVLLNPRDTNTRNNITIMEEIAHDYLGHRPSIRTDGRAGVAVRDFSRSQEKQAYALGAAAVLPAGRLERLIHQRLSVAQIAISEELSRSVVTYRIRVSGAGLAA